MIRLRRARATTTDGTEPAAPSDEVIVTRGLTKTYGHGLTAVDGLDLSVHRGEIFGLLGPNGAGKTTTLGMLTARIIPTAGLALVGGIDIVADPARAKQSMGVVPQTNTLDRSLSVEENLYFHGRYFGMGAAGARARTDEMLERFRLADRRGATVDALSGGMAQRLMLARAVLHRPALIFLDEPTVGLDPQSRLALWDIMGELHAGGETILLTTHYMEEAERFCDRVAIMDHGRILALDTPAALRRSLGTGAAAVMQGDGDAELLAAQLTTVPGVSDALAVDGQVRLNLDAADGALPRLIAAAERAGFHVTDLSVNAATLESVFIALTGRDLRE